MSCLAPSIYICVCACIIIYEYKIYIFHKLDVVNNTQTEKRECTFDLALAIKRHKADKQNSKKCANFGFSK